ncbi:MAG: hypothetical protein DRH20_08305 [Deltaproteobacteria bacterium]|nr:MAG: hypothetical protein DRH20_08305 [Deltaproteobacteria bacterium]
MSKAGKKGTSQNLKRPSLFRRGIREVLENGRRFRRRIGGGGGFEEARMEIIKDYFLCDQCSGKDFKLVYRFSLRFHGVNFSDELIYDKLVDELYECTGCRKTFTKAQIEEGLSALKRRRRKKGD